VGRHDVACDFARLGMLGVRGLTVALRMGGGVSPGLSSCSRGTEVILRGRIRIFGMIEHVGPSLWLDVQTGELEHRADFRTASVGQSSPHGRLMNIGFVARHR